MATTTKTRLLALLKLRGIRSDMGCECHSVEALADEILAILEPTQ